MKKCALLLLFFFSTVILSCNEEDCGPVDRYFSIQGLQVSNLVYTGQGMNPWKALPTDSAVKWTDFFLRIRFEKMYHSHRKITAGANLHALSCFSPGYEGSKVGIDTLYVIVLQDYNSIYQKNDTINDIVYANYSPISRYVAENDLVIRREELEFKLTSEPAAEESEYQFKIVYILDNGSTFEKTSGKAKLLK